MAWECDSVKLGEGMAWANSYLQFTKAKQSPAKAAASSPMSRVQASALHAITLGPPPPLP